jgi:hypothetical protein
MPRRKKPQAAKRDWRWYLHTGLNVFVVLSMVLGTVVLFTGGSFVPRTAAPTAALIEVPTLAPTVGAPLPTPVPTNTPAPRLTPTPGP